MEPLLLITNADAGTTDTENVDKALSGSSESRETLTGHGRPPARARTQPASASRCGGCEHSKRTGSSGAS